MSQHQAQDLDKVFKALGHMTRRRILQLLSQTPRYPYELSKMLNLNRRVVLKHLAALEEAGLIDREAGESNLGPDRTYYRLNVSFGISTTILPNAFILGLTSSTVNAPALFIPAPGTFESDSEISQVKLLLVDIIELTKRLQDIEDERLRLVALRGQLLQRMESMMRECGLDAESCKTIRTILDPIDHASRISISQEALRSAPPRLKEILTLFEEAILRRDERTDEKRSEGIEAD